MQLNLIYTLKVNIALYSSTSLLPMITEYIHLSGT